jgi:tetratricopeptide (TPR) repeat protein
MAASRDDEITPEQWEKAKAVFDTASELTGSAREAYLAAACRQDPRVLSEVKSLLEHSDGAGNFMRPQAAPATKPDASSHVESIFLPGQLVGDRFEILKFIGRGGMGEVYQARDQRLNEIIAIKAIRPEALSEGTVARLKRETLLARRITHANVCRVFDLEQHQSGDGAPEILFLTMEYIEGETLAQGIRRQGRMQLARQNDPLSLVISTDNAKAAYYERRYDDAVHDCLGVLEMDSDFGAARVILGQSYTEKHMYTEAIAHLKVAAHHMEQDPMCLAALGYAQGRAGFHKESRELLNELTERSRSQYVSPFYMAQVALGLGNQVDALKYLDQALNLRAVIVEDLALSPAFDCVRSMPQFSAICRQVGLPEQAWTVP